MGGSPRADTMEWGRVSVKVRVRGTGARDVDKEEEEEEEEEGKSGAECTPTALKNSTEGG